MAGLILFDSFDAFREAKDSHAKDISPSVVDQIRQLDECADIEPFIRAILSDTNETAHGPAEIVDILTHKITLRGETGMAAFILKGKSFPIVRPKHISHQIYRLGKIDGLHFAFLVTSGSILDAAKEEFTSTAERLQCSYSVLDAGDLARLFVAYGFFCPRDGRRISSGRCHCGYSPNRRFLNQLQKQSLSELAECHTIGQKAALVVLPPGTGKTRIAAEDAKRHGAEKILYVAHTHEILDVAESEFAAVFGVAHVQRLSGEKAKVLRKVNLATIQSLKNRISLFSPTSFDFVIIDEFHHAAAVSYRRLIDTLKPAFLLGLSATPFRGDRQDIASLCHGNVLVNAELRTGIDSGILAPYHYFGAFDDVDYSTIKRNGLSYTIRDLEKALVIPARDAAIIAKWKEHANASPTLAFCCSHTHATRVAASFRAAGVPAKPYLATTPQKERRLLASDLEKGKISILCVVDVLNEGADFPFVECLLFLRPTESKRIFFQQLGRGLRRFVGKAHCTVIDFIGNFKNAYRIVEFHGLIPYEDEDLAAPSSRPQNHKELLNLPIGCEVHFDEKVIDIFAQQALDPRYATRHNIGRILMYQYLRLKTRMKRSPTRADIDRNCPLHVGFYRDVFGSWDRFLSLLPPDASE